MMIFWICDGTVQVLDQYRLVKKRTENLYLEWSIVGNANVSGAFHRVAAVFEAFDGARVGTPAAWRVGPFVDLCDRLGDGAVKTSEGKKPPG
jgi:hypothetical protein